MKRIMYVMFCIIIIGLGAVQNLSAQQIDEAEANVYKRIDMLYNKLVRDMLAETIVPDEFSQMFDAVDREVQAVIDSIPEMELKEKATLVSYKGVYQSLGRYVKDHGGILKDKMKNRIKGLNINSPYIDQLPYIQSVNLLTSYKREKDPATSMLEMGSFVLKHTKNPEVHKIYVLSTIRANVSYYGYSDSIGSLMKEFRHYCKDKEQLEECGKLEKGSLALSKGCIAPELEMVDEDGNAYKLSDFRGKYVLMDVWVATCGPCIQALPALIEASDRYKKYDHVVIMSLSIDAGQVGWLRLLEKKGFSKKMIHMRYTGNYNAFMDAYCIGVWGRNILIDPEGKIVNAWHVGPKESEFTGIFNREVGIE